MNYIMLLDFLGIKKAINSGVHAIFLWIDSVVYYLASLMYDIFIKVSEVRLFDNEFLGKFANRIYVLMGVIMLFFLAYALLKAIIDPEQLSKGDKSVAKMVPNIVISLVIIGFLPTIFDYLYDFQDFILKKNIVGTLVFGTDTQNEDISKFGNYLSITTLNAFLNPENLNVASEHITWEGSMSGMYNEGTFGAYHTIVQFASEIVEGKITYKIFISTVVGIFLLYLLVSFTLDLGVRAVKLSFLQLISPIPVIMRALPNKKGTFDDWLKQTATCYFEVFIRVFIMYMLALFARQIFDIDFGSNILVNVIIVLGIFAFAKDAPKLISDVLGLPAGNLKLGIKDKIAPTVDAAKNVAGGVRNTALGVSKVGGVLAAGGLGAIRNWNAASRRVKEGDLSNAQRARSVIAGATSGLYHGITGISGAKNFKDFRSGFTDSANQVSENREKRFNYYATHGKSLEGVLQGKMNDAREDFKQVIGIDESPENMLKQIAYIKELKNQEEKIKNEAKRILGKFGDNSAILEKGSTDADGKFTGDIGFKGDNQDITKALYGAYLNSGINNFKALKQTIEDEEKAGFRAYDGTSDYATYEREKTQFSIDMANKKSMLAQVEKKSLDRVQNNAYNLGELGITDTKEILEMRTAYKVAEDILKEQGKSLNIVGNTSDAWKTFNDQLDNEKIKESQISADAESLKRKQEARKKAT